MASDRAKWSNYVHSHKLGTQSVNTTPFCAGTQALVPKYQVWTAPFKTTSHRAMSTMLVEAHTVTFPRFFFHQDLPAYLGISSQYTASPVACLAAAKWGIGLPTTSSNNWSAGTSCGYEKKRDLTNIKVATKEEMVNKSIGSLESLSNCPLQYHR